MNYEKVKKLSVSDFKRRFGISRSTFNFLVKEVKKYKSKKSLKNKRNAGRKPKLSIEEEILLTLDYWREYRTQFHLGLDYGISESAVSRTIHKIENILSKVKRLSLPKSKKNRASAITYEVILIDATETPIERPKKNSDRTIRGKRAAIQ